jgi:membrane protease YdiL (CAAX protease family)
MTTTHLAPPPTAERSGRLRRGLAAFAATEVAVTLGLVLVARANGADVQHLDDVPVAGRLALFGGAFVPTISMLVAWLASGIRPEWGLRRPRLRMVAVAWTVPVLAALLAYLPAWLTDIAGFDVADLEDSFGGLPAPLAVLVAILPGLVPWIALALGEQLGWSSWLVVRMSEIAGRSTVALTYGVAWGLAHVPLMLLVPGAVPDGIPTWYAVPMFLIQTVTMAWPLVWLRLEGRSIWPVLVLHAGMNACIYFVGDLLTVERSATDWFLGEGALLTSAGTAIAVLVTAPWWRRPDRDGTPDGTAVPSSPAPGAAG